MKKIFSVLLSAIIVSTMVCTMAFAETNVNIDDETIEDTAGNVYTFGNAANFTNQNALDVIAAGNSADISGATVEGNIFAAGNQVSINDTVSGASIYAAGNSVSIKDTEVEGNVYIAGNQATINNVSAASVNAAASSITVNGSFSYVSLAGNTVELNGYVDGDVVIEANNVIIGDGVVITGKLTIRATNEPDISKATYGEYEFVKFSENGSDINKDIVKVSIFGRTIGKLLSRVYWLFAMGIIALILCFLFGRQLDEAKDMIKNRTVPMIASGAITWLSTPVLLILLCITIIGAPTAALGLMIYVFMIVLGSTFAGATIGRLLMPNLNKVLASLIGVFALIILDIVPVIGVILSIAADMFFMGYIIQKIYLNITTPQDMPALIECKDTQE